MVRHLVLDGDPGIDDALALLCALAAERDGSWPALALVTAVGGNLPAAAGAANARRLLEAAGAGAVPVSAGPDGARVPERPHPMHGSDGLGDALPPSADGMAAAADAPARLAAAAGPETGVLGLGPATGLAAAEAAAPGTLARFGKVVLMAGAVDAPGNAPGGAEYNAYGDPAALAVVLGAARCLLVPLDVTRQVRCDRVRSEALAAAGTPLGRAVATMLAVYHGPDDGGSGRPLHDPLAWLALARPELFRIERVALSVDADSGATRRGGPLTADVALGVDAQAARAAIYDALESACCATRTHQETPVAIARSSKS